jgi:mono/diheme cytochrome c family protein
VGCPPQAILCDFPAITENRPASRGPALGNCDSCHTAAGGVPYAGGRPVPTPFGSIYASNVTPDSETGIGRWSEAAFRRALHAGVDRQGRQLYPAFPYPHYARVSDADVGALYAFLMTRPAVRNRVPANRLPFPLNYRWIVAGWKLLFFHPAASHRADDGARLVAPEDTAGARRRRGADLVEGLGHCGDCHRPRNFLGAERTGTGLAGGESEGWDAPALDGASPAPLPWTAEELFAYLRYGAQSLHGAAAGPMQQVTRDLRDAADEDVRDMALYIASQLGPRAGGAAATPAERPRASAAPHPLAPILYSGACAGCHRSTSRLKAPEGIDLEQSTLLSMAHPRDALRVILGGIAPPAGQAGPWMPSFAGSFTDAQLVQLLDELRARFSTRPPWSGEEGTIRQIVQSARDPHQAAQ